MKEETKFYDGTKIMSLMDINGKRPELYIITSNRAAGKTVFYDKLCFNRYVKYEEKFAILVRDVGMLDGVHKSFFGDIQNLYFEDYEMTSKMTKQGFAELFCYKPAEQTEKEAVPCGYAIAIKSATKIKNNAHRFVDVQRVIFDEFQVEDGEYIKDEVDRFLKVQRSISRGGGEQYRYVPFYLIGNHMDLFNPYYEALGICDRLKIDTKFLRGDGWVLEQNINKSALEARRKSGIHNAFAYNKEIASDAYLYDNLVVLEKPYGHPFYRFSVKFDGKWYGVLNYMTDSYGSTYFITDKPDMTFREKYVTDPKDVSEEYMWFGNSNLRDSMARVLKRGMFRFKNLSCKSAAFKIFLNYRI